jgi:protocatechuate 3,4-dioxygenase alpha subunit
MGNEPVKTPFTPEATIGPFYPGAFLTGLPQDLYDIAPLLAHRPQGRPIVFAARFLDSAGGPVPSLVVEFWQANAAGRYRHPDDRSGAPLDPQFDGFARLRTGSDGVVRLHTIKPGAHAVAAQSAVMRAPHLRLTIFASGIDRLVTQVFFDDEPLNESDPVLVSIPDPRVRERLIARRRKPLAAAAGTGAGDGAPIAEYELDVVLRGAAETPFFDDWS